MSDNLSDSMSGIGEEVGFAPSGGPEDGKKDKKDHKKDSKDTKSSLQLLSASSKKEKKDKKEKKEKETRYSHLGDETSGDEGANALGSTSQPPEGKSPAKSKLRAKPLVIFGSAKKDKRNKEKNADDLGVSPLPKDEAARDDDNSFNPFNVKSEKQASKEKKEKSKEKSEKKLKLRKSSKHHAVDADVKEQDSNEESAVFGVPLDLAVKRSKCHDGICLPLVVRQCIDYIEEHGLKIEGVYRSSGVKSKVNKLKTAFNSTNKTLRLTDYEPAVVASVLKQFLRELPDPVLTHKLMPKFEAVAADQNPQARIEGTRKLIAMLPDSNRTLLQWVFVHMSHVIERERFNKMTLQNVSIVLSPTMNISHRVLNCLFQNSHILFDGVQLKKYIPPITGGGELPDTPDAIREEISKQESLLGDLHLQISSGAASKMTEESIWEQQRIVTQLKRKLRTALAKPPEEETKKYEPIDYEEELDFRLQQVAIEDPQTEPPAKQPVEPEKSEEPEPERKVQKSPTKPEVKEEEKPKDAGEKAKDSPIEEDQTHKVTVMVHNEESVSPSSKEGSNDSSKAATPETTLQPEKPANVTVIRVQSQEKDSPQEDKEPAKGLFPLLPKPPSRENRIRPPNPSFRNILQPTIATTNPVVSSLEVVKAEAATKSKSLPRGHQPWPMESSDATAGSVDKTDGEERGPEEAKKIAELQLEFLRVKFENEELEALKSELEWRKKSERREMEELREEMATMQTLYQYRTYSVDSSESSDNDDKQDVKDIREETESLRKKLSSLIRNNQELQEKRLALFEKIQQERRACIQLRVEIKVEQERKKMLQLS